MGYILWRYFSTIFYTSALWSLHLSVLNMSIPLGTFILWVFRAKELLILKCSIDVLYSMFYRNSRKFHIKLNEIKFCIKCIIYTPKDKVFVVLAVCWFGFWWRWLGMANSGLPGWIHTIPYSSPHFPPPGGRFMSSEAVIELSLFISPSLSSTSFSISLSPSKIYWQFIFYSFYFPYSVVEHRTYKCDVWSLIPSTTYITVELWFFSLIK